MTVFGKLLAFLNLVIGIGFAMWSVNVYTNRPAYFDPIPEYVDKGNNPETFKGFAAEIDSLSKAANGASAAWTSGIKLVEDREAVRTYRSGKFATRLKYAREGNPAKGGAGFTQLVEDPVTKLIDVDKEGTPIIGPPPPGEKDGQPLRGANTLLALYNRDAAESVRITQEIKAQREKEAELQVEVQRTEVRYLKQADIRENQKNEAAFLSAFEVTVYEYRETAFKRKRQLLRELEKFNPKRD